MDRPPPRTPDAHALPPWRVVAAVVALIGGVLALVVTTTGTSVSTNFNKVSNSLPDGEAFDEVSEPIDSGRVVSEPTPMPTPVPTPPPGDVADEGTGEPAIDRIAAQPIDIGRSIVYVASLEVVVDDVAAASRQAQEELATLGGLLFGLDSSAGAPATAVLTFKVSPTDFQAAMAALESLGRVTDQLVSADDVTERVVDLESRIRTQETSVARLRDLLDGASDLDTIGAFEAQLLSRETELETLRAQLRTVEQQVALATIVLRISERETPSPRAEVRVVSSLAEGSGADACPGDDDLEIEEGEEVTLCVSIRNTGTAPLRDLFVGDRGFDLQPGDLAAAPAVETLEPGDEVTFWASDFDAVDAISRPSVTATSFDIDDRPLSTEVVVDLAELAELQVDEDRALPGFREAVGASWGIFTTGIGVVVLVAGALVPFAWLLVIGGAYLWRRRRGTQRVAPV